MSEVDTYRTPASVRVIRAGVRVIARSLARLEVSGLENLPMHGGGLLILNHLSNIDPALIFAVVPRDRLTGMVAADYRHKAIEGRLIALAGGTWLRRGESDRDALEKALALMRSGWIVGIAPEGRRSPTRSLQRGKRGPAFLAHYAGMPIYPVAITGTEHWLASLKRGRRPVVRLQFGAPFRLPEQLGEAHRQYLEQATDWMMCELAALLPSAYRGVYADHPLVNQILSRSETRSAA